MAGYDTSIRLKATPGNLAAIGQALTDLMALTGDDLWLHVAWDSQDSTVTPADLFEFFGARVQANSSINIHIGDRD